MLVPIMETLPLLLFSFFFFSYTSLCSQDCKPLACGKDSPELRFPFYLHGIEPGICGYRGFGLSCNQSQPVLNLPLTGNYNVTFINYETQQIFVDPDFCIPGRIFSFTLQNTPFRGEYTTDFTIYNCSSMLTQVMHPAVILECLGGDDFTVVAKLDYGYDAELPSFCRNISRVAIPVQSWVRLYGSSGGLQEDLQLTWDVPNCKDCESKGGICKMNTETEFNTIGCSKPPRKGLPRSAKYGVIVGVGIPSLVFIIGLACFTMNRVRAFSQRQSRQLEANSLAITPQQALYANGLDGPTIESYPTIVLGESGRLPKPNDGTCPICLAEYLPKDTLRTVPECNHYFHATCIDEWLKLNATCPVCRNTPESSSVVTPCSSVSSSSTSSTAS